MKPTLKQKVTTAPTSNPIKHQREIRRIKFKNNRNRESFLTKTRKQHAKSLIVWSDNTTNFKRTDRIRDDRILRYIVDKLRNGQPVKLSTDKSYSVYKFGRSIGHAKRNSVRTIPKLFIPHWDHASPHLKMLGWSLASHELSATPFTLNIDPKLIERGKASRHGIARYLQDRISRQLRRRIPDHKIDFWFAIEQGSGDEPHLHGAITIPIGEQEAVAEALRTAGGNWRCKSRQLKLSLSRCATTWIGYSTKWKLVTEGNLQTDRVVAATKTLRSKAKELYNRHRHYELTLYPL